MLFRRRSTAKQAEPRPAPISGEAHSIQQRTEQDPSGFSGWRDWVIWTFRLERYDESGNRLPPVPVEMRGLSFEGFISEGDQVELPLEASKNWRPGQLVKATQVQNITTGAFFRVKKK